jgi:hypothetical protein
LQPLCEVAAMLEQPQVLGVKIGLGDNIIRPLRHGLGLCSHRTPEIYKVAVEVVYRLDPAAWPGRSEQHGAGTKKRLDVVLDVSEPRPNEIDNSAFPAKIRERRN